MSGSDQNAALPAPPGGGERRPSGGERTARLRRALAPAGVAVIGASPRPGSLSARFVSGLLRHGFPGRVVPVNPNYDEVLGLPCAPDIGAAGPIDLAVLSVPRRLVPETLEACDAAGVAGVVIFASGYSETGAEGAAEEREIAAFAERTGLRVIGPNSPGFVNATERCSVIASGAAFREPLVAGPMAVVAQSGGVAGLLLERAQDRGVGVSQVVCTGNEADVTVGEVLGLLAGDPATGSAAVYMEAIRQGPALLDGLRAMRDAGKGVVMLKVGATEAGARASAAHTGALADDDDVVNAALDACGAVRVTGFDDLIATAGLLGTHGPARTPAIGIVSTSGGAGVVATEAAERAGLVLPPLGEATRARLVAAAPDFAAVANPADMSGMFVEDPEIFRGSLAAFLEEPAIEAVVLVLTVHPPELSDELARRSIEAARAAERPLVVLWTAGAMSDPARAMLREAGVPVAEDADRCMTRPGREGPRRPGRRDAAAAAAGGAAAPRRRPRRRRGARARGPRGPRRRRRPHRAHGRLRERRRGARGRRRARRARGREGGRARPAPQERRRRGGAGGRGPRRGGGGLRARRRRRAPGRRGRRGRGGAGAGGPRHRADRGGAARARSWACAWSRGSGASRPSCWATWPAACCRCAAATRGPCSTSCGWRRCCTDTAAPRRPTSTPWPRRSRAWRPPRPRSARTSTRSR